MLIRTTVRQLIAELESFQKMAGDAEVPVEVHCGHGCTGVSTFISAMALRKVGTDIDNLSQRLVIGIDHVTSRPRHG